MDKFIIIYFKGIGLYFVYFRLNQEHHVRTCEKMCCTRPTAQYNEIPNSNKVLKRKVKELEMQLEVFLISKLIILFILIFFLSRS